MKFFATFFLPLLPIALGIHEAAAAEQVVLPNVPMDPSRPTSHVRPTLFDLLTIEPSSSIFFSYARELQLSRLFSNVDANITVLVPTNKAVMALARKPHQVPGDTIELSEQEMEERSGKNVERWVSLHIIPESQISLPSRTYPTLVEGRTITFKETKKGSTALEWQRVLVNGDIPILNKKEAINGVLYVIDGTIQAD
ncbi:hypothetical protein F5148DRAFT_1161603 [Russula earlei]|uniref:Uncharacterized protein n=1 Tax=Russula earlei TaxID=71964 RepID=A0ACC0UM00_9AGAM|nr:hypothetical protein F5148DRAFT_1161603 [Russula earlei]